ncbi:unnamed protein product [Echinostoma caproni]|uniref:RES domain-containing protein n=1 Tax=Echinostoma caproni TaxID=27848 RepID=A0A183BCZ6_9TREM|nr:unnamed protein product [Echinostoma caproni]
MRTGPWGAGFHVVKIQGTDKACASSWRILGAIDHFFSKISYDGFRFLYTSYVRTRLEFASAAVYPCTTTGFIKLEGVQRAPTGLIAGLRGRCFAERLQASGLFLESYRRARGDIICVRRIPRGDVGPELMQYFPLRTQNRTQVHIVEGFINRITPQIPTVAEGNQPMELPSS